MLCLSVFDFLISLLTGLKAPAQPLWYVALGATEWGHYLAIGSLLLAFGIWRKESRFSSATLLALLAAALYLTPLGRAGLVARQLPNELARSFGDISPHENLQAPARPAPLVVADLFRGVPSPQVRESTVVYAHYPNRDLYLNLFQPVRIDQSLPGVVVVHGGSWQSGDRGDFAPLSRYLAARGYVVASIDYRLAPGAIYPAPVEDVFSAIAYLKSHAASIGLDKTRMVLLGRSAGGQIALSAAYTQKEPGIKGVILFYAPNDLEWGYAHPSNPLVLNSRRVIENYLGGTPHQVAFNYKASSPLFFINKNTPATLMIHGVRDELVSSIHEERLVRRLREEDRPCFYLRLPWATHGCDINFSGPCGQLSTYAVERFLAAVTFDSREEKLAQKRSPHARQNRPA